MKKVKSSGLKPSLFICMLLFVALCSCSDDCDNAAPRARINNNGTGKASVQIQTSGGNTENINNIEVGQTSAWSSYAPGQTQYTIAIQGVAEDTTIVVDMLSCWEYDIVINSANTISSTPRERD